MRNITLLPTLLLISISSVAQDISTAKFSERLNGKDYLGALQEMQVMRKKVMDLAAAEMVKALPKSFGAYSMKNGFRPSADGTGSLTVSVDYENPANRESAAAMEDPTMPMGIAAEQMIAIVSNNLMMANDVVMAHSMEAPMSGQEAVRIKGYRALLKKDEWGGATGTVIVGGAMVQLNAVGHKDTEAVRLFLESVDTAKLKALIGE